MDLIEKLRGLGQVPLMLGDSIKNNEETHRLISRTINNAIMKMEAGEEKAVIFNSAIDSQTLMIDAIMNIIDAFGLVDPNASPHEKEQALATILALSIERNYYREARRDNVEGATRKVKIIIQSEEM
ncbi:hypothetical protein [Photobacterium damselae]|uniref:hypothetical protein n=1 Tax=Photobacterium damselae TaxID=38293 RepID=UPI001F47996A|nr:hypothetical protein [Photobacterium damselae]UKA12909.1 hypothetical protein IHC91_21565 [Photobacterium damselae subsp. damselae]